MKLVYDNIMDILVQNIQDSNYTFKGELNKSLNKLIENDTIMTPEYDNIPDVWRCNWYNVLNNEEISSRYGYMRGQAVWINTEDITSFINKKWYEIENTVVNNPNLSYQYNKIKDDKTKSFQFFVDIVSGKISGALNKEPLYFLGEISNDIQLRISLIDRNTSLPNDDNYWKDFFEYNICSENKEELSSFTDTELSTSYIDHLSNYHLYGIDDKQLNQLKENLESTCVKTDLSNNISSINLQAFQSHRSDNYQMDGFDYVSEFKIKKGIIPHTIKWYKIWKSGYVEQGGIICDNDGLNDKYAEGSTNKVLNVLLPIKYDYLKQRFDRFYQIRNVDGFDIDDQDCLAVNNRYNINVTNLQNNTITPYSFKNSENSYESNEILCVKNEQFSIHTTQGHTFYSFYVSGFVKSDNIELLRQIIF